MKYVKIAMSVILAFLAISLLQGSFCTDCMPDPCFLKGTYTIYNDHSGSCTLVFTINASGNSDDTITLSKDSVVIPAGDSVAIDCFYSWSGCSTAMSEYKGGCRVSTIDTLLKVTMTVADSLAETFFLDPDCDRCTAEVSDYNFNGNDTATFTTEVHLR